MSGSGVRRMLHASTALVLLIVPLASWGMLRTVLTVAAVLAIGVEVARLRRPGVHVWLGRAVPVFRPSEERHPSGAMWLAVGYAAACWFPAPAPAAGILVAALADPSASIAGALRGSSDAKTWAGTVVHLAVSTGLLVTLLSPWHAAVIAAGVGALVERWSGWLDDNVAVPPTVSAVFWMIA